MMSPDDASDAVDSIIASARLDGRDVDPTFRGVLMALMKGELTVDEAMRIALNE